MLLLKKKKGFSISEGIYQGILIGIYDLGWQQSEKYSNEAHKICLVFELPDAETTFDEPVTLSKIFTYSLHDKAALRPFIVALLGRAFTKQEDDDGIQLSTLLGANVQLQVVTDESNGKTRSLISNAMQLPMKTKKLKPVSPPICYEIDEFRSSPPDETPKWITALIMKSKEFNEPVYPENQDDEDESIAHGEESGLHPF